MSKIYLADKFGHKMKMRHVRDQLQAAGHEVTSKWVDVEEGVDSDASDEKLVVYAKMDLQDVDDADVLMAFSYPRSQPNIGGGRHIEFGYALARGKRIVVVGPKGEHIFHWMPGVKCCATIEEAKEIL